MKMDEIAADELMLHVDIDIAIQHPLHTTGMDSMMIDSHAARLTQSGLIYTVNRDVLFLYSSRAGEDDIVPSFKYYSMTVTAMPSFTITRMSWTRRLHPYWQNQRLSFTLCQRKNGMSFRNTRT